MEADCGGYVEEVVCLKWTLFVHRRKSYFVKFGVASTTCLFFWVLNDCLFIYLNKYIFNSVKNEKKSYNLILKYEYS